ncbi:MAG: MarR family transcriptional regulator, partial [Acidimicrobiales bacterium]|nr:MarR family transcriptional regulator [Acidimicrobiales bacterium]
MQIENSRAIVFELLAASDRVQRRLDGSLANIKGISFSEYQLLLAIQDAPGGRATRVDLAAVVGLTPSGVTRALKPLEKLGFVETTKDDRDARRSMARLTSQGTELTNDATGVV